MRRYTVVGGVAVRVVVRRCIGIGRRTMLEGDASTYHLPAGFPLRGIGVPGSVRAVRRSCRAS